MECSRSFSHCIPWLSSLEEWLQHSAQRSTHTTRRKRQCEICKFNFNFTPVYSPTAPAAISWSFFLSQITRKLAVNSYFYWRLISASIIWLILFPYILCWIWRIYFHPSAVSQAISVISSVTSRLFTALLSLPWTRDPILQIWHSTTTTTTTTTTFGASKESSELLYIFFADVFQGQMVAATAAFITITLLFLREYILINTPQDQFGRPIVPGGVAAAGGGGGDGGGREQQLVDFLQNQPPPAPPPPQPVEREATQQIFPDLLDADVEEEYRDRVYLDGQAGLRLEQDSDDDDEDSKNDGEMAPSFREALNSQQQGVIQYQMQNDMLDTRRFGVQGGGGSSASSSLPPNAQLAQQHQTSSTLVAVGTTASTSSSSSSTPAVPVAVPTTNNTHLSPSSSKDNYYSSSSSTSSSSGLNTSSDEDTASSPKHITSSSTIYPSSSSSSSSYPSSAKGKGKSTAYDYPNLGEIFDEEDVEQDDAGDDDGWEDEPASSSSLLTSQPPQHVTAATGTSSSSSTTVPAASSTSADANLPPSAALKQGSPPLPMEFDDDIEALMLRYLSNNPAVGPVNEPYIRRKLAREMALVQTAHQAGAAASSTGNGGNDSNNNIADVGGGVRHRVVAREPPPVAGRAAPGVPRFRGRGLLPGAPPGPALAPPPPAPLLRRPLNIDINMNINLGENGEIGAEINAQGDLEAFYELIGIEGPLRNLFATLSVVIMIMIAAIGLVVWIPYNVGKPSVYFIREVYFPFMDSMVDFVWEKVQGFTDPILDPLVDLVVAGLAGLLGMPISNNTISSATNNSMPRTALSGSHSSFLENISSSSSIPDLLLINNTVINNNTSSSNASSSIVSSFDSPIILSSWLHLSPSFQYISTGYLIISLLLYHQARQYGYLNNPYLHTLKRTCKKWMVNIFLGFKFIFFITIELGLFPTYCGFLIDFCTLPLFGPSATIVSRLAFYSMAPYTSFFLHWLVGTTFMFQFAMYVSTVREIVRPGVMWFVRDPNDPHFQPMQEILDRGFLLQLRKLTAGVIMYTIMILGGIGGFVVSLGVMETWLRLFSFESLEWYTFESSDLKNVTIPGFSFGSPHGPLRILPLKWEFNNETLSDLPFDLLIFHFIVPFMVSRIAPTAMIKYMLRQWFVFSAKMFRLTSFLFGGEHPEEHSDDEDEEERKENVSDSVEEKRSDTDQQPLRRRRRREFRFMRVPKNDHIEIIPKEKVLIRMTDDQPVFGRAKETPEEVEARWMKLYVPAWFWTRVLLLMVWHWFCQLLITSNLIGLPLCLGRVAIIFAYRYLNTLAQNQMGVPLMSLASTRRLLGGTRLDLPFHDSYSLTFGIMILMAVYALAKAIYKLVQLAIVVVSQTPGLTVKYVFEWLKTKGVNYTIMITKGCYLVTSFVAVIPMLVGLVYEFYIAPLRSLDDQTPIYFFVQDWMMGLMYMQILYGLLLIGPETSAQRVVTEATRAGLLRMRLWPISKIVILPAVSIGVALALFPLLNQILVSKLLGESGEMANMLFNRISIPLLVLALVFYEVSKYIKRLVNEWRTQILEENFLIGRTLHNMDVPDAAVGGAADQQGQEQQ